MKIQKKSLSGKNHSPKGTSQKTKKNPKASKK